MSNSTLYDITDQLLTVNTIGYDILNSAYGSNIHYQAKFNPSIISLENNYFVGCYRIYVSKSNMYPDTRLKKLNNIGDRGGPWARGNWWQYAESDNNITETFKTGGVNANDKHLPFTSNYVGIVSNQIGLFIFKKENNN